MQFPSLVIGPPGPPRPPAEKGRSYTTASSRGRSQASLVVCGFSQLAMFEPDIYSKYPSLRKMQDVDEDDIVESHDGRETALLRYIYKHPELDRGLRGSPSGILAAMDEFAAQEDFLINIGSDKARKLAALVREHRPSVVVELGGYIGYASCFLLLLLLLLLLPSKPHAE